MKPLNLFLSGLCAFLLQTAQAQQKETLEGNGNRIVRSVSVQPFTALDASGVYELKLTQGNLEAVTIEADENLQPLFTVRNEGHRLVIEMKDLKNKNLQSTKGLKVHVTFKNLNALDLKMVGNVSSNNLAFADFNLTNQSVGNVALHLKAKTLHVTNESVGEVVLSGQAENAVVKNSGVGSLKAGDLVVQTLEIDNSGVGAAEVNAAKGLKVRDSFLGKVKNRGAAPVRKMNKVVI